MESFLIRKFDPANHYIEVTFYVGKAAIECNISGLMTVWNDPERVKADIREFGNRYYPSGEVLTETFPDVLKGELQ